MKYVDNPAVQWSALDIEAHIDPIIERDDASINFVDGRMEYADKLEHYFHELIEEVFEVNQDDIIEFINRRIQDHLYYNREEIINEIKSLIKK